MRTKQQATKGRATMDYRVIAAYGYLMGSFGYYIHDQQEMALHDGAPVTAVYKRDGAWVTLDQMDEHTQRRIEARM